MNKTFLLLLTAILFSPTVSADDLRLRVATLGYEDAEDGPGDLRRLLSNLRKRIPDYGSGQDGAGDRKETILRSIETQIIPGNKFSVSCRNGTEIIELRGSSTQDKESNVKISLHYKYRKITAEAMEAIRSAEGDAFRVQHIMNFLPGTSSQTSITLKPGDSEDLGMVSQVSQGVDAKKSSAYRIVVSLVDRDMEGQKTAEPTAGPSDEPKRR